MQTKYSNTFLLRRIPHSGARFQLSKSYKRHGRRKSNCIAIRNTRMRFRMDLRSFINITTVSMRSLHISCHSVRLQFSISGSRLKSLTVFVQVLHPYFKLAYIEHNWGDGDDSHAKNWKDDAEQLLEQTVSAFNFAFLL